jgi:uncharacterized protein
MFAWLSSIHQIDALEWNQLSGTDHPFTRHEFFAALEDSGCVGGNTGWIPRHLCVHSAGKLQAIVPGFLKTHSYGEYVFDWSWAQAYQRIGLDYYPKLVCAVPFSPVPGPRLLISRHADEQSLIAQIF